MLLHARLRLCRLQARRVFHRLRNYHRIRAGCAFLLVTELS